MSIAGSIHSYVDRALEHPPQSVADDGNSVVSTNRQQPSVATPEDADHEVAAAAAEVGVMERSRARDTTREEALMGTAANEDGVGNFEVVDESGELVRQRFLQFLMEYAVTVEERSQPIEENEMKVDYDEPVIYPYAEQATQMARKQLNRRSIGDNDVEDAQISVFNNTLFLDFEHVLDADLELAEAIQSDFSRFEPYLRRAIQAFVLDLHPELDDPSVGVYNQTYFVAMHNLPNILPVRRLRTDQIGRLISVSGTVTRASDVRPELLVGTFRCNKCGNIAENIQQHYHYTRPTVCRNPRCQNQSANEFTLEIQQSEFVDWQKLRVQENSDEIPPGSMPRSIDVMVRNEMVERAKAGDQCIFTGTLVVIPDGSALARAGEAPQATRAPSNDAAKGGGGGVRGLKALGVRELTYRTCFVATSVIPTDAMSRASNVKNNSIASLVFGARSLENHEPSAEEIAMEFSNEQRDELRTMKSSPRLYEMLVDSIAPTTFGHREIKKGILLMLLGGVHKTTEDGTRLRGDINCCIVGDPSTAKSQFLKYVHAFLPSRAVYTSGKASSAAGLTAAVQRDQDTGEYCIEAGALMLADNGICCIDEFDKMDPSDQVAIHEAMEQQTISITKAGIHATLNARASILAAANPIYGRYDRTKTLKAHVALSAPILSRFDLFFVVLDDCNPEADDHVARHIIKVHRCEEDAVSPPFTKEQMQRYIRLAKTINPKMTPESQKVLIESYRMLRQSDTLGRSRSAYRITVRQLESMIRLSEALARVHCDNLIQPSYVREAARLLKTSIIQVETSDVDMLEEEEEDNGGDNDDDSPDNDVVDDDQQADSQEDNRVQLETQAIERPGEYGNQVPSPVAAVSEEKQSEDIEVQAPKPSKKKKTKMSFEEFEAMSTAIASHLRSLEAEMEGEQSKHLKWSEVVEWYLEQCEHDLGDSLEALAEMRKKVNLVVRRLVRTDMVLITVGTPPTNKREEQEAILAVHPNYVVQ